MVVEQTGTEGNAHLLSDGGDCPPAPDSGSCLMLFGHLGGRPWLSPQPRSQRRRSWRDGHQLGPVQPWNLNKPTCQDMSPSPAVREPAPLPLLWWEATPHSYLNTNILHFSPQAQEVWRYTMSHNYNTKDTLDSLILNRHAQKRHTDSNTSAPPCHLPNGINYFSLSSFYSKIM